MYDVLIVGAGIIGSFLAHDLSKYKLKVAVLEKESDVAAGATMANSAIVHAGHDPKEGTLKARLNVRGNRMYEGICRELGVSFWRTSALLVSVSEEENLVLDQLYRQAVSRGITVNRLSGEAARAKEKNLSDGIIAALELPTTGIIYPWEVATALMEEAMENQVELFLKERVCSIERSGSTEKPFFTVHTEKGIFRAKYILNAAGVYADEIYKLVDGGSGEDTFVIKPRKGEYYVLDKRKEPFTQRVIYPTPSEKGKGVLVVPTTHGNTLLGPDSIFIEDKQGIYNTREALDDIVSQLSKTVKNVPMNRVIRTFAGLRPTGNTGDFVIEEAKQVKNFINVACIESPGLASAPAISEYVCEEILNGKASFRPKEVYRKRRPAINLSLVSTEERDELVRQNPAFGRIICRCEQISEGEILDAIRRPLGARTVKGVKKRVRPGMGRCQGGFCEPRVIEILARELGISPLEVRMDGEKSTMLTGLTKGGAQA